MDSHSHVSPGETCSDCGMHRKIMDSIPARPLTRSEVEALGDGDGVDLEARLLRINQPPSTIRLTSCLVRRDICPT